VHTCRSDTEFSSWHCPHSMQSRVYVMVRSPSVCPVVQQPLQHVLGLLLSTVQAGHIDWQQWVPTPSNNGTAALHSATNAGIVQLTGELMRLNANLFILEAADSIQWCHKSVGSPWTCTLCPDPSIYPSYCPTPVIPNHLVIENVTSGVQLCVIILGIKCYPSDRCYSRKNMHFESYW